MLSAPEEGRGEAQRGPRTIGAQRSFSSRVLMHAELGAGGVAVDQAGVGVVAGVKPPLGGGAGGYASERFGNAGQCKPVEGSMGSYR